MYIKANSTGVIYEMEQKFQQKEGRYHRVYYKFKPQEGSRGFQITAEALKDLIERGALIEIKKPH